MPFTFLSHQATVAPLKLWRPRWFDGTALVLGSMAPDFEKFITGGTGGRFGHTLRGQLLFVLPVALVVYWMLRRWVAPGLAAVLRDGRVLHLRDYARSVADGARPRLALVVPSILVGSVSHVLVDGFTHADPRIVALIPALRSDVFIIGGRPVWTIYVFQLVASVVGAVVTLLAMLVVARRRRALAWASLPVEAPPRAPRARRWAYWAIVAVVAVGGAVGNARLVRRPGGRMWSRRVVATTVLRFPLVGFAALCAAGALAGVAARPGAGAPRSVRPDAPGARREAAALT